MPTTRRQALRVCIENKLGVPTTAPTALLIETAIAHLKERDRLQQEFNRVQQDLNLKYVFRLVSSLGIA